MKKSPQFLRLSLLALALCVMAFPSSGKAADDGEHFPGLLNVPASISIGGGGVLDAGHAITAINSSYREKDSTVTGQDKKNNKAAHNTTFINMLKLRYGVTDRMEIQAVVPYTLMDPKGGMDKDSWGDVIGVVDYGWLQEKFGDPLSISTSFKLAFPTGDRGVDALPGSGAYAGTACLGVTKTLNAKNQLAANLWITKPFEEGNQHLHKGTTYAASYKWVYALTRHLGVGIEGVIQHDERGTQNGIELKNDDTEWYTGPAVTWNIPNTTMDVAFGAYVPVYREYGQNTASDDVRFDGKFFIYW